MNAIGDLPEKPVRKSRRRDRWLAIGGAFAVIIVVWLSEVPQERIGDWAFEHFIGTGVQFEYGSAIGALHIDSLTLFSTIEEEGPPVIQINGLSIDYDLFPKDGRWIREVVVEGMTVLADATDPDKPNFAFIQALLAEDDSEPLPASVIPKSVRVENIAISAAGKPTGSFEGKPFPLVGLSVVGLSANAELDGDRVTHATLAGDGIRTRTWTGNAANAIEDVDGYVEIVFDGDDSESQLDIVDVNLPGLIAVAGMASSAVTESASHHHVEFSTLKLDGTRFDDAALPIAFAHIDASGFRVDEGTGHRWEIPCAITGLRLGNSDQPLYNGDLQLAVDRADSNDVELAVTLNDGQLISAQFNPELGSAVASVDAWTPEMIESAVPPTYRDRLSAIPEYRTLSLTFAASAPNLNEWIEQSQDESLVFDFSVFGDAALPQDTKESGFRIESAGNGVWGENTLTSATVKGGIVIAGERAAFDVARKADESFASTMTFDDVNVGRWLKLALGDVPVGTDSGVLNGTIAYDGTTGNGDVTLSRGKENLTLTATIAGATHTPNAPLHVVADVTSGGTANLTFNASGDVWDGAVDLASFDVGRLARLIGFEGDIVGVASGRASVVHDADTAQGKAEARLDGVRSEEWSLQPDGPIELAIAFESDPDFQSIQGGATQVSLNGETIMSMDRWDWTQDPWQFTTTAEAKLDLDTHGKAIGVEGWGGDVQATLSITHQRDRWQAPVRVVWNDPKIRGLEDLYAGPITVEGNLSRAPEAIATTLTIGNVAWGEHTQVKLPRATIESSPFGVIGEVNIESDMTVLVALGAIQYVDGAMTADGEVRLIDGNPQFDLTVDANVAALEMPNGMAAATNARLMGGVSYDGQYHGEGTFSTGTATSAGAILTEIAGGYAFNDDRLALKDVAAKLYSGDVTANGEIELLTGTYNSELNAGITRLDLDRFTKEFEPGEFRLTGMADGELYVRWSTDSLSGARFGMTSTEGFSLDRETVETLLTSRALPDQWGMRWIAKRINKKMVGDEPQRPFDSARIDLLLQQAEGEQDRLTGPISLKSETLDFNIEWAIDLEAIYAAMESELSSVENISAGAVESENQ